MSEMAKTIEHTEFMEELEKRKKAMQLAIVIIIASFIAYFFLLRPLLRAYL